MTGSTTTSNAYHSRKETHNGSSHFISFSTDIRLERVAVLAARAFLISGTLQVCWTVNRHAWISESAVTWLSKISALQRRLLLLLLLIFWFSLLSWTPISCFHHLLHVQPTFDIATSEHKLSAIFSNFHWYYMLRFWSPIDKSITWLGFCTPNTHSRQCQHKPRCKHVYQA